MFLTYTIFLRSVNVSIIPQYAKFLADNGIDGVLGKFFPYIYFRFYTVDLSVFFLQILFP